MIVVARLCAVNYALLTTMVLICAMYIHALELVYVGFKFSVLFCDINKLCCHKQVIFVLKIIAQSGQDKT